MTITENTLQDVYRVKLASVDTMELKGFELIKELFVDSSGMGQENEMALTQNSFLQELKHIIRANGGKVTAKITNAGQFQVYVGLFKKIGKTQMQKVGNNTYKIETPTGYKIRLHDTNVIEYNNGNIILNSGGFQSHTTKDRINKYLPTGYKLFQKDWAWYVHDYANENIINFNDKMVLTG